MKHARLWAAQLIVFILVFASPALAQTSWWRTYGGTYYDWGNSVQQTTDGGYIIAGATTSFGAGGYDVYLIKTNSSGDTLWTRTYGGTGTDLGNSVQQTSDGGYIVTGATWSFGAGAPVYPNVYLIRANASGDTLWTRTYGGTDYDEGYSVRQTSDGGYVIAGVTNSFGAGNYDVYLIKTDATGDTQWTRTYGGTSDDEGRSVQQTSDGGYTIAGGTTSSGVGGEDVYLIKTNSSGDTLWTRTYGGTGADLGNSVQQTSDGGYIVTGETWSFGAGAPVYPNVYLIRANASGDTLWTRTYGGTNYEYGYSVQQTSDGGYIIAGYTNSFGAGTPGYSNVYLIKTDAEGSVAVAEPSTHQLTNSRAPFRVQPNPFSSFAQVSGHETERFTLSDISGRKVGIYNGSRIGEGLAPGVYFVSPVARPVTSRFQPLRVVKGE